MNLQLIVSVLFAMYIPIYMLLVWYVVKKFYGYTTAKYSISYLGTLRSRKHRLFNTATVGYGFIALVFSFILKGALPQEKLSDYLVLSLATLGMSIALIALLPVDIYKFWHDLFAVILFGSSIALGILSLKVILSFGLGSSFWILVNAALIFVALFFGYEILIFIVTRNLKKRMWNLEWVWAILIMLSSLSLTAILLP